MIDPKSLLVGAVAGVLSVVLGVSVAKADCSRDYETGIELASAEACDTNYGEVVTGTAGEQVAWCVPDATAEACIEVSSLLDCSLLADEVECDETMGRMFEACVQLAYSASR